MWNLYCLIAIGGVLLAYATPKEIAENDTVARRVAFMLTWPLYLVLDMVLERRRGR